MVINGIAINTARAMNLKMFSPSECVPVLIEIIS